MDITKETNDTESLDSAFDFANAMYSYNLAKDNIKLKIANRLVYSVNGGTFSVTTEFLNFLCFALQHGEDSTIMLDNNKNPILIPDVEESLDKAKTIYNTVMAQAYEELKQLESSRNIKQVFDK